jgi:hypothetical protein
MKKSAWISAAAMLAAGSVVSATPVLQMDLNSFGTQATNSAGANSAFGGLSHTGAVKFSIGAGVLNGIFIQAVANGPFANANFAGFTLTGFSGQVNLNNGAVTGGNILVTINNNDTYACNIAGGSGGVSNYVGGGFKIEALTASGFFNDSQFGNVNVNPWFSAQGLNGLIGSFLQFNFAPNATGSASSDMDLFVDVPTLVPLPPAAWAGLATLGGMVIARRLRRR